MSLECSQFVSYCLQGQCGKQRKCRYESDRHGTNRQRSLGVVVAWNHKGMIVRLDDWCDVEFLICKSHGAKKLRQECEAGV